MFEYTYPFHYGLSFASATESGSYKPELVFLVNSEHWSELSERIHVLTEKMHRYAQQYSHDTDITFSQCSLENIKQAPFGYNNCAYVQIQDEQLQIHLVLIDTTIKLCALTINTITSVLSCVCRISVPKRSFQTIELSTLSGTEHLFHGHATGGNISTNITDWLQKYVRNTKPNATEHDILYLPNEIILAMKETWGYIHTKPLSKKLLEYVDGFVRPSGHFSLQCHGNACDLSVYPDQDTNNEFGFIQLSSHNLDSAAQQLTLLAGLAKLCDLARAGV